MGGRAPDAGGPINRARRKRPSLAPAAPETCAYYATLAKADKCRSCSVPRRRDKVQATRRVAMTVNVRGSAWLTALLASTALSASAHAQTAPSEPAFFFVFFVFVLFFLWF